MSKHANTNSKDKISCDCGTKCHCAESCDCESCGCFTCSPVQACGCKWNQCKCEQYCDCTPDCHCHK